VFAASSSIVDRMAQKELVKEKKKEEKSPE
jgi:hypothetical protein